MAHAKRSEREKARALRLQGMSVKEISETLKISRSSASTWVRDIELTQEQIGRLKEKQRFFEAENRGAKVNREKFKKIRQRFQNIGRQHAQRGSLLHTIGCMLYWAEGGKGKNQIIFANSDPYMTRLFVDFLRQELNVQDEKIGIAVHCHTIDTNEHERIRNYWLDLLQLPPVSFKRIYVKTGSDTRKNRLENGVCRIEVMSTELLHHIYGAIQEYGGFTNEAWLF